MQRFHGTGVSGLALYVGDAAVCSRCLVFMHFEVQVWVQSHCCGVSIARQGWGSLISFSPEMTLWSPGLLSLTLERRSGSAPEDGEAGLEGRGAGL